ncbi:MAG: hypothetical protein ACI8QZ_001959 [Chlamydiales bacterium]
MTHTRAAHLAGWLVVGCLLLPWRAPAPPTEAQPTLIRRLIGPAASLAASVYWIRFDLALRDGEHDRAYVLAERALRLEPSAPAGWHTLARHLIFDRASLESEPDPRRRRAWIEAGLAVFEQGEAATSNPGHLAYLRGTILTLYVAEIAVEIDWPGGAARAESDGLRALDRARTLGHAPAGGTLEGIPQHDHAHE